MNPAWTNILLLVLSTVALAGWWLTLRPRSASRGVSATMCTLVVVMSILLCILAFRGQFRPQRPPTTAPTLPGR